MVIRLFARRSNITMHPHSTEKYIELFKKALSLNNSTMYQANHYALIGSFHPVVEEEKGEGFHGGIYRFLNFESGEPWINLSENKEASEEDLEEVNIPDNLRPGYHSNNYIFFPKEHLLFFERSSSGQKALGPKHAKKIFENLLNQKELTEKYGRVDVTIEPSYEALDKILKMPTLSKLKLTVTKPNPDFFGSGTDQEVEARFKALNAKNFETELTAEKNESLTPDEGIRSLANVAASNGKVIGSGYDENGIRKQESTENHPYIETVKYDPDTQGIMGMLITKAKQMKTTLMDRRNQ